MDVYGNSVSEADIRLIKEKLEHLESENLDKFQKSLKVLGYITYLFEKAGIRPILVGGHAVELYTAGHYTTVDIDLVLSGSETAGEIFTAIGFKKTSRYWFHERLSIPVEIPDNVLAGSAEKVIRVELDDPFAVYVIGIEDLILDRARAAVYWNSERDREWALIMIGLHGERIDFDYLEEMARKESSVAVLHLLRELRERANHKEEGSTNG